jgi:tRNA A-37 threonylcarbamoyl transferase component Bud32
MAEVDLLPRWGLVLGLLCLVGMAGIVLCVFLVIYSAHVSRWMGGAPRSRRPGGPRPVAARRTDHPPAKVGHCPECGTALPPDSPDGLCPQCLLQGGLGSPNPNGTPRTTPYPGPFEAPTPAELASHFPQLEVLELIGQGGMGAVYKARQTKLDRVVALKVLPPEWGSDPAFAERFGREARTLAKLNHPHIVAVHDFGEAGGLCYLVMEYVDGPNLREVLQAGKLQPEQALAVIPQICEALQYAHEEGVVHRDIKPENILLDRQGRVKIADFGLAKLLNRPRAEFTLTGSRQVMGTLDYMAPEQRSRPLQIDHRADIYSLGVVFYEMLTGELPLGRFAPPSERAGVDARLDEVVHRALETDPERRYQSVSDVKTDVEAIAGGQAPAVIRQVRRDGGRGLVLASALHQLRGPGTGLCLAGLVAVVLSLIPVAAMTAANPKWPVENLVHTSWWSPPPLFWLCQLVLEVALGGILLAGGLKMRRCEAYELALMAAIVAMVPLTGAAYPLSLPMGIWAAVVLAKRRVRAAFTLNLHRSSVHSLKTGPSSKPTGRGRHGVRGFLRSVRAMFFTSRPADRSRWEAADRS